MFSRSWAWKRAYARVRKLLRDKIGEVGEEGSLRVTRDVIAPTRQSSYYNPVSLDSHTFITTFKAFFREYSAVCNFAYTVDTIQTPTL
jgi:hypothetical protein